MTASPLLSKAEQELPRLKLILATVVVGLFIVLGELDRLISRVSSQGYAASMTAASAPHSPIVTSASHPWLTLHNLDPGGHGFVWMYTAVDLGMAAAYGSLLWVLLRTLKERIAISPWAPVRLVTVPRPWMIWVAVAFDVAENILLFVIVQTGSPSPKMNWGLALFACIVTDLKWVALALAVLPMLYAVVATQKGRAWAGRWGTALYKQRFSLVAVLPIAALALIPGPGILDQLPDIQRAWFDVDANGPVHAAAATFVLGTLALLLFVLGRMFTDEAVRRSKETQDRPRALLKQWLFGPVIVALGVALVAINGSWGTIRWIPLGIFCAIPLFIAGSSWLVRWRYASDRPQPPRNNPPTPLSEIWRMGDMLAIAILVVASLGLVRSFTVLLALGEGSVPQRAMPFLGLGGAVLTWWLGVGVLKSVGSLFPLVKSLIDPDDDTANLAQAPDDSPDSHIPRDPEQLKGWILAWVCIVISTALLAWLTIWPVTAAEWVGVLGAVTMGLGNLMLLIGASVVVHAVYRPPEIFRTKLFRIPETPVVSLLVLAVLAASAGGSTPEVHGIRSGVNTHAMSMNYEEAVLQWSKLSTGCFVEVDGKYARPMIFVAAEGGGIRAAYWTASVLQELATRAPCGISSIVVASGVSGGAVGLQVVRVTPPSEWVSGVTRMGDADALAEASIGLLLRDPFFTVTGVPPLINGDWLDRAGLMETAWERKVPRLADDFYANPLPGGLAAPLVLNATDGTSGCRVLVTHLQVEDTATAGLPCADAMSPLPYSRDFRTYMSSSPKQQDKNFEEDVCINGLKGSTAAMLAARFPYVTPSGVVGPCGEEPRAQIIDGGYAEGSGLGSLVDMSPHLLAEATKYGPVLPIFVFLDNGRGGDLLPPPPQAHSELLVPPLGSLIAGKTQNSTAAWLQRALALRAGEAVLEPQVFVVAQGSDPTVEAPLGWVLSKASRNDMKDSLEELVLPCDRPAVVKDDEEHQNQRHADLEALLRLLGRCE